MTTVLTSLYPGDVGVRPRRAALYTHDNYETITQMNYVLPLVKDGNPLTQGDYVFTTYGSGVYNALFTVDVDLKNNYTLIPFEISPTNISNANIVADAGIDFSKLAALTSANILLGNNNDVVTSTPITGDISISNTGVTTISDDSISTAKIELGAITTALIDDDAITNDQIAPNAVTNESIMNGSVDLLKLDPLIQPAYIGWRGGASTFAGGSSQWVISVPGISSLDIPFVQLGTITIQINYVLVVEDGIQVNFPSDPGPCEMYYIVMQSV